MPHNPFEQAVRHLQETFGISADEALQRVQDRYDTFKTRNERLLERQNDEANKAQINLTNHCTLLAIGVLTIGSAFVGSVYEKPDFTDNHISLFILLVLGELVGLTLCLIDYVFTNRFHKAWAKTYQEIDKETEKMLNDGTLQLTSQLGAIESKHIDAQTEETTLMIEKSIIGAVMGGVIIFFILLLAFFFDVPFYK